MHQISEKEFERLCKGIFDDRALIIKHNPLGSADQILLWMLLSVLIAYLSLSEQEIPCFTNSPDGETYRTAIKSVVASRSEQPFDSDKYLNAMISPKI